MNFVKFLRTPFSQNTPGDCLYSFPPFRINTGNLSFPKGAFSEAASVNIFQNNFFLQNISAFALKENCFPIVITVANCFPTVITVTNGFESHFL